MISRSVSSPNKIDCSTFLQVAFLSQAGLSQADLSQALFLKAIAEGTNWRSLEIRWRS